MQGCVPDGRRRRYKGWQRYYLTRKKALATFLVECAMAARLVLPCFAATRPSGSATLHRTSSIYKWKVRAVIAGIHRRSRAFVKALSWMTGSILFSGRRWR